MAPNKLSTGKDPVQLLEEADGHPQWLREVLTELFQRLPPHPPRAPAGINEYPAWDPKLLAKLQLDPASVPLGSTNRWYVAAWLKQLAGAFIDGTEDEGDSHKGFTTIYTLRKTQPSSEPRKKRGEQP